MIKKCKWSIDACVGYARANDLFSDEVIPCTKTIYNAIWNREIFSDSV